MRKHRRIVLLLFRIIFGLLLLGIHFVIFPLPIVEAFMAYIIVFNPRWFRELLRSMAEDER